MEAQTAQALVQERTSELTEVFDLDNLRIGENLELFEDSETGVLFLAEESIGSLVDEDVVVKLAAEETGFEMEQLQMQELEEQFEEDEGRRLQPVQRGQSDRRLD